MSETSFFTDMLQSITDRGRKLLFSGSRVADVAANADTETLCEMLLSSRGEASGMALAAEILDRWSRLDTDGARQFFVLLSEKFGPDTAKLEQAIETYRKEQSSAAVIGLHQAAEPRRQELLRRLNQAPSGTARLVRMREQLLRLKEKEKGFQALDADFTHLFSSWFNRGFLSLRPIEWSTQANILEKIIAYEAVHEIAGWEELRRRLAPSDRRCFAFFHPRLADEPLVFVEVALTRAVPANIHDVLDETREQIAADEATTAVFYSISNCQDGLRGISFGNFLIKQVVDDLKKELPGLTNFVTLSPVPGFARWLSAIRTAEDDPALSAEDRATLSAMDKPSWSDDAEVVTKIERIIVPMAAHYFLTAKTADGRPIDPVARFHLGNGARLERLNFLGDRSPKAMKQAHGLMVNYLYKLDDIVANHEALAQRGEVAASPVVRTLLKQRGDLKTAANAGGFQSRPRKS
ncbi:MAG: malonyl-CoA decarboxylase [Agrobacterium vaccinii]